VSRAPLNFAERGGPGARRVSSREQTNGYRFRLDSSLFFGPQFVPNHSQRMRVLYHESAPLEGKPLPQRLR
jgi:hypothetical protein